MIRGDVEHVSAGVVDHEKVLLAALDLQFPDPAIYANPMSHVDDVIPFLQVEEAGYGHTFLELSAPPPSPVPTKHLVIGDQSQLQIIRYKSLAYGSNAHRCAIDLPLRQHVAHPLGLLTVIAHDGYRVIFASPVLNLLQEKREVTPQTSQGPHFETEAPVCFYLWLSCASAVKGVYSPFLAAIIQYIIKRREHLRWMHSQAIQVLFPFEKRTCLIHQLFRFCEYLVRLIYQNHHVLRQIIPQRRQVGI